MPTEWPLVSIVVPCLNTAYYLESTIESILRQNYPYIEIIVVDGGSTDKTLSLLMRYDDRIKWISETDEGHADAINKGWKMSKGEILSWMNADDGYAVADAVSKAVDYLRKNPTVDVIYGDYRSIDSEGNTISDLVKPRKWNLEYAVKYCHYTIPQPASFIRRNILEKVNWLDTEYRYAKDHELWLRIGLVGTIEYTPTLFAYARQSEGLSQHVVAHEYKIRLVKKFFSVADLLAPFNSKRFRRRSMSNAYLVASNYAYNERHLNVFLKYILTAFITDPLNLPYIVVRTGRLMRIKILIPKNLRNKINKWADDT